MSNLKSKSTWVSILGALVALGILGLDVPGIDQLAENIVAGIATAFALTDTVTGFFKK